MHTLFFVIIFLLQMPPKFHKKLPPAGTPGPHPPRSYLGDYDDYIPRTYRLVDGYRTTQSDNASIRQQNDPAVAEQKIKHLTRSTRNNLMYESMYNHPEKPLRYGVMNDGPPGRWVGMLPPVAASPVPQFPPVLDLLGAGVSDVPDPRDRLPQGFQWQLARTEHAYPFKRELPGPAGAPPTRIEAGDADDLYVEVNPTVQEGTRGFYRVPDDPGAKDIHASRSAPYLALATEGSRTLPSGVAARLGQWLRKPDVAGDETGRFIVDHGANAANAKGKMQARRDYEARVRAHPERYQHVEGLVQIVPPRKRNASGRFIKTAPKRTQARPAKNRAFLTTENERLLHRFIEAAVGGGN